MSIKIPLTLAIISALIVKNEGQSFAIPQVGVVELVRISADNKHLIETVNGAQAMRLRGTLLSLVHLNRLLGTSSDKGCEGKCVIVIQVDKKQFGLVVGGVYDTEEVVVKPLGRYVTNINVYAGTTILGDGRVILILDAARLADAADILSKIESQAKSDLLEQGPALSKSARDKVSLLLFKASQERELALPLSLVSRLEEFETSAIEYSSSCHMIQYRGRLMPIVAADPSIDVGGVDPQPVIVFADGERSMGLTVHSIEDVVQDTVRIEMNGNRPGILGTSVINGSATEVIDIHHYIQQCREDWFQNIEPENVGLKLLVVDDSSFFQNLLGPILMSAGHDVVFAGDGEEAMQTLSSGPSFDLVLSDIERPNVNGLQLAARIRENPYHCDLPLIALTGQGSEEIGQRALDAGFNDYLVKVDKDAVLGCLNDYYHSLKRALV